MNARIRELLVQLNARVMRVYRASRRQLYEQFDRPALRPLPLEPFVYGEWKYARVNIDYHVDLDGHYYSVPHPLQGETIEIWSTSQTVEVYSHGKRVASHVRSYARGRHTTEPAHMPKAHQKHLEWTPSRLVRWGERIGPDTGKLVEAILADRRHPEQGYRSCLGILRLARQYGRERLEAACRRALTVHSRSYRDVASILKNGLDRVPLVTTPATELAPLLHENLRGPEYYQ